MSKVFGARLKALRKQKKLSQSDLGRKVGVGYNQIGLYERGVTMPSAAVLPALARAFETTVDDLLSEPVVTETGTISLPAQAAPLAQKPTASEALDKKLTELIEASRELSEADRRTVISLLEAFVLRARITVLTEGQL